MKKFFEKTSGVIFDNFAYQYLETDNHLVQNRLYHINDTCANNRSAVDIDDQGTFSSTANTINTANNYGYDEIGNLMRDSTEQIANIEWTVYGKVKSITRDTNSIKPDLEFLYDPTGNRIAKIVKPYNHIDEPLYWVTTYYTRDAQGNIMATYKHSNDTLAETPSFMLMEHDIYGSSRIGTDNSNVELISAQVDASSYSHTLGLKQFELINHLGNVLATVSDKKIAVDANSDGTVDYYKADIVSAQDYHPFGSLMAERSFSTEKYSFGMNGQEKDDEIYGEGNSYAFKYRMQDTRTGRFWSVDPLSKDYPWNSTYAFAENRVIDGSDLEGKEYREVGKPDQNKIHSTVLKLSNFNTVLATDNSTNTSIHPTFKNEIDNRATNKPPLTRQTKYFGPQTADAINGTISQAPSNYEKFLNLAVAEESQNMVRYDPFMKSISVGGLAIITTAAAVEVAPSVAATFNKANISATYNSAKDAIQFGYYIYENSIFAQFVVGGAYSVVSNEMQWSPDTPDLPNGVSQVFKNMGDIMYLLKSECEKQNESPQKDKSINDKETKTSAKQKTQKQE